MNPMTTGLAALVAGYGLSQFFRAFLAVMAPILGAELGLGAGDLAVASGLWFLAFAAVQLPIGWALDSIGPRRTAGVVLGLFGGGGAALFAVATQHWQVNLAMTLLGIGCAPVLMGAYYLVARCWPPAAFGGLAGVTVGLGSFGDILGAVPLVSAIEAFGWRPTLWGVTLLTVAVAGLILLLVRDPAPPAHAAEPGHGDGLGALLRLRGLWPMLPLIFASYASSVAIRGLWESPFLQTMHDGDARLVGRGALVMGLSMVVGNLAVGRLTRVLRGPRRTAIVFTIANALALGVSWLWPHGPLGVAMTSLAVIGASGCIYALLMSHARLLIPGRLVGRGITFLNMISLAGVGVLQFGSRPVYQAVLAASGPEAAIAAVFLFFLVPLVLGLGFYLLSPENAEAIRDV